jgi:predicted translin family RNA/ssDNA-binding protein
MVPKYIASKNNDSVIFEFHKDGKTQRKWVKKGEIVLLTEDKNFFIKTMEQFKAIEETQQKLVDEARKQLDASIETFTETVNSELNEFNEIKNSSDVPCILKNLS